LWYTKFSEELEGHGFKFHPYDPCVENRLLSSLHTFVFHVDNLKSSQKDQKINDDFAKCLQQTYGKTWKSHNKLWQGRQLFRYEIRFFIIFASFHLTQLKFMLLLIMPISFYGSSYFFIFSWFKFILISYLLWYERYLENPRAYLGYQIGISFWEQLYRQFDWSIFAYCETIRTRSLTPQLVDFNFKHWTQTDRCIVSGWEIYIR